MALREASILAAKITELIDRWVAGEVSMKAAENNRTDANAAFDRNAAWVANRLADLRKQLAEPAPTHELSFEALIGMRSLREIVEINREEATVDGNPLVRRNADLLRNETIRRWRLADGDPDDQHALQLQLAELRRGQIQLSEQLKTFDSRSAQRSTMAAAEGSVSVDGAVPLFSTCASEYVEIRKDAKMSGAGTARYRLEVFLELVGDRPIDAYRPLDLQRYVNELQYLPRDFRTDRPAASEMKNLTAREAIEANRDLKWEPLALKTIQDGYVQTVKAAISFAASNHHIRHPFAGIRLRWPTHAKPSVQRSSLDNETMDRIFRKGLQSGYLDDAMLLPLSFLTSRRIGLLAYLKGSDFMERHGVTIVQVSGITFDPSSKTWRRVPFKTDESLRFFVLHDLFRRIGFVDWAKKQGDAFLFRALHGAKDPSAVASQRANRLLDSVIGARSKNIDVAHSFRHGAKDLMQDEVIADVSSRLQMGHEISNVHANYGRRAELRRQECMTLAEMKLPSEIDWTMFEGLDFQKLASRERAKGRPKQC